MAYYSRNPKTEEDLSIATKRGIRIPPRHLRGVSRKTIERLLMTSVKVEMHFSHECHPGVTTNKSGLLWKFPDASEEKMMPLVMTFYIEEYITHPHCCRDKSLFTFKREEVGDLSVEEYEICRRLYADVLTHKLWEKPEDRGLMLPRLIRSYHSIIGSNLRVMSCIACPFNEIGPDIPKGELVQCHTCRMSELLTLEMVHRNDLFLPAIHPKYAVSANVSLPYITSFRTLGMDVYPGKKFQTFRVLIRLSELPDAQDIREGKSCHHCRIINLRQAHTTRDYSKCVRAIAALVIDNCPSFQQDTVPTLHVLCEQVISKNQHVLDVKKIPPSVTNGGRLHIIEMIQEECEFMKENTELSMNFF